MNPEAAIAQRIVSLPAVTAIAGTRVWLVILPQSPDLPAVRVQQISKIDAGLHTRGAGGVGWARVQVDAVCDVADGGNGYDTASALTAAIHGDGKGDGASGLLGWRGAIGSLTILGISSILDEVAEFDPDELTTITIRRDYLVWFQT